MALLPEQVDLLKMLVEASRRVPRFQQQFLLTSYDTDQEIGSIDYVQGAGLAEPIRVLGDDVWALDQADLISGQWNTSGSARFTVTGKGYSAYETLLKRASDAAAAIEEEQHRYLDGEGFRARFPAAYERLVAAEHLLWQANPESDLTTVGHKLREAIQQFATALVERHKPPEVDSDPAKTKNRLRAVLELHRDRLGERKADLLGALIDYQDAINGVVQRLEHADQKPDDPASWEDARSAVFQTMNFLVEFDRLLAGSPAQA